MRKRDLNKWGERRVRGTRGLPEATDAEVHERMQRYQAPRPRTAPGDGLARSPDGVQPPGVTDEIVRTLAEAANPSPRALADDRRRAAEAPADLAEAQLSLVGRCTICGKPVTGRDVPRDRQGRPRHHRCT
jgi:hypothetical protein